jgi:predicted RNA-binding Zn ribbon-like protein
MSTSGELRSLRNAVVVPRRELSIDLANTVVWRGSAPEDSLHGLHDVLAWLTSVKAMPVRAVAELGKWFEARPAVSAAVFSEAIEIREMIYRLLHSVAAGSAAASEDIRGLNRALGEAAPRTNLERVDGGFGWRAEVKPTAAAMLAPALWSAADILTGPDRARVRECANDRCLWLFLDDSKNGSRRWCSMQSCGNRAKARRHYLRERGK